MAATHYGTLNNYRPDQESIKTYLDQVDLYFMANTVPDDKQVPILLSSIGATTYSLLCDLLEADTYHLYRLTEPSTQPITVTVKIEDTPLKMEIDTGAAISIISEATRKAKFL